MTQLTQVRKDMNLTIVEFKGITWQIRNSMAAIYESYHSGI